MILTCGCHRAYCSSLCEMLILHYLIYVFALAQYIADKGPKTGTMPSVPVFTGFMGPNTLSHTVISHNPQLNNKSTDTIL